MTSARDLHRAYVESIPLEELDADCPEYGPPAPRGHGFPPNTGYEYQWSKWLDPDDRPIYTSPADVVQAVDDGGPVNGGCDDEDWSWLLP
jgi:hypothetical protein